MAVVIASSDKDFISWFGAGWIVEPERQDGTVWTDGQVRAKPAWHRRKLWIG